MAYKELILPQKLSVDEKSMSDSYAKFVAEPYERGYGHTVGNALRRVLLSSLEGAAVTAVRIEKATHEYQALPGVKEDVMNILLNLKKLRVKLFSNGPETVYLSVSKEGVVTAKDVQGNANVEIVNKDLVIAHLEAGGKIDMEIEVSKGRGYVPAEELRQQNQWAAGFLPVDALFSPVVKVHYEIWTDGSLNPAEALIQSSKLLRESLNIFIPEEEQAAEAAAGGLEAGASSEGAVSLAGLDPKLREILNQPIEMIELSSRASNCLKVARIRTIGELVGKRDEELLAVKNFGKKSLDEIKDRLKDMGLSLGMQVGQLG